MIDFSFVSDPNFQIVLSEFTASYFWWAVGWSFLGLFLLSISSYIFYRGYKESDPEIKYPCYIVAGIVSIIAVMCIVGNLNDLIVPEASAYKNLMRNGKITHIVSVESK